MCPLGGVELAAGQERQADCQHGTKCVLMDII